MRNASDSMLPSNFPFGSPAAARFVSHENVIDLLQRHRGRGQSYIDGYLSLYQPIFPIIDIPQFSITADNFWDNPKSVDISWLASFLMVFALGCFAVSRDRDSTVELCMAAEACLSKTPFMVRPDLSTARTLCLMVIAKQTTNTTCQTFDSCWTFLGILTRISISVGLTTQLEYHAQSVDAGREWQSARSLWLVIVYFCIHVAAVTGKPPLLSVTDIATQHASPLRSPEIVEPWATLSKAYPTICRILIGVNDDTDQLSYDEILEYNDQVKELLTLLDDVRSNEVLYITLDIFFRRILLVLHHQHALHPSAPLQYPVSYWSSLECSLAILVHYRDLCEYKGRSLDNMDLLGRLFKLDFFYAMLTVCLHLLRHNAPLTIGFAIPPRRTIMDTLQACTGIWERETHTSMCFSIGHRLLTSVLRLLSNVDNSSHCDP